MVLRESCSRCLWKHTLLFVWRFEKWEATTAHLLLRVKEWRVEGRSIDALLLQCFSCDELCPQLFDRLHATLRMDSHWVDMLLFLCSISFLLSSWTVLVSAHRLEKGHLLHRDLPCHIHLISLFGFFIKLVACRLVCAGLQICHCEIHMVIVVTIDLSWKVLFVSERLDVVVFLCCLYELRVVRLIHNALLFVWPKDSANSKAHCCVKVYVVLNAWSCADQVILHQQISRH